MATNLNMPQMGYDMQEGTLVRWLKSVGDEVSLGEAVAEIETDKAVVEFESTAEGVLLELLVEEGTTVAVGESIATVGAEGEALAADGDAPEEPAGAEPAAEEPSESDEAEMPATEEDESESAAIPLPASLSEVRASPVARKLAAERGVDLSTVEGTGPGGRILRADVLSAEPMAAAAEEPEEAPAEAPEAMEEPPMPDEAAAGEGLEDVEEPPSMEDEEPSEEAVEAVEEPPMEEEEPVEEAPEAIEEPAEPETEEADDMSLVPLTRMRQQIARVTVGSKTTIPHFYVTTDIDMTEAMSLRREINQSLEGDVRVSVNDLVIKACVHTIRSYPKFNSSYTDEGIRMHDSINIGMAIAEDGGLIMPAILDCEQQVADGDIRRQQGPRPSVTERYAAGGGVHRRDVQHQQHGHVRRHELRRDHSAAAVCRVGDRHCAEAARRTGRQRRRPGDYVRHAVGRPPGLGWGRGRAVHRAVEGVPRTSASAACVGKRRGPILLFEGLCRVSPRCVNR